MESDRTTWATTSLNTAFLKVLSRRTKNNPVLIGEPGVGKVCSATFLSRASRQLGHDNVTTLIADGNRGGPCTAYY